MENNNMTEDSQKNELTELEDIEGLKVYDQYVVEEEIWRQINEVCREDGEIEDSDSERKDDEKTAVIIVSDAANETETERKIRLGEMTPFGTVLQSEPKLSEDSSKENSVLRYLQQQEELQKRFKNVKKISLKKPDAEIIQRTPKKRRRKKIKLGTETVDESSLLKSDGPLLSERMTINFEEQSSGSEYYPSDESISSEEIENNEEAETPKKRSPSKRNDSNGASTSRKMVAEKVHKEVDDGDECEYQDRLRSYERSFDTTAMMFYEFDNSNFKVPLQTWTKLYNYQKVGVQWLWELHQQEVGGILGDEMGLGKTIQMISFFSGLFYSKLKNKHVPYRGLGPSLIVCPTTLMHQWVKEFHKWLPPIRIAILHASGSYSGQRKTLVREVFKSRGFLVTSYVSMVQYSEELLRYDWHYVILDEGHKIRNPDAKVTLTVKQIKTPHRIILSGSPLQNNLEELWSLFDFIYPGKLGALPLFQSQFSIPITHGGYTNASNVEVTIAYKCATVLKDLIAPYLLRRAKLDVKSHISLPEKNEQVLFCQLTDQQRTLYRGYLDSGEVSKILDGQTQIFVGLINLRKICNHPDLYSGGTKLLVGQGEDTLKEEERYGYWNKSGKMIVLETLLKIWHKQGHKVLLFSQSKRMLDILELFVNSRDYKYLKMDGGTSIGSRQPMIDTFNTDSTYFVMLLTTKVGGLGVNLTGANRIIIYDPDWNPATDTQARERAWRIGQTQNVTIYRLITVGTIEEKIYHRQIFKQFLTNKVLKDPKQRRFFKSNDLFELFTLKESHEKGSTETGAIFAGTGSEINLNHIRAAKKKRKKAIRKRKEKITFSESKIEKMKELARQLSQKLMQQSAKTGTPSEAEEKCSAAKDELTQEEAPKEKSSSTGTQIAKNECSTSTSPKKKEHRKSKKSFFEGEFVPNLVKSKPAKALKMEEDCAIKAEEDEYVLKKLFQKSGVCSALQHDTIMEGGPPDFALVEKEAERVAEEAINELKRSQEFCFGARTGIPNWTGKHGKSQSSGGGGGSGVMSSSDILNKIRKRNGEVTSAKTETQILSELKTFLTSAGGTVSTDVLIQTFQPQLSATMTPFFKSLLNKVCTFYRAPDGKGYWSLKEEFH